MAAYYKSTLKSFLDENEKVINSDLTSGYASDNFFQLLGTQSKSWINSIPIIREALKQLLKIIPSSKNWGVILEYPLYRLRKRIDLILISQQRLYIFELKVGAENIESIDKRQVEEYALDLRDFHKESHSLKMSPILCCTEMSNDLSTFEFNPTNQIQEVSVASKNTLASIVAEHAKHNNNELIDWRLWEQSPYEPVPSIIEAATTIFAGHNVQDISRSDAENLLTCSKEVIRIVDESKKYNLKRIIIVTGVPGSGKTLAGLNIVHQTKGDNSKNGDIVYLSGNTPLVLVIREALAQDEKYRSYRNGIKRSLKDIRHELKTRIQHINDFLKEYYSHDMKNPPFEHAIVFDEAQRAWDHKQGNEKFGRDASEPELLIDIMDRHVDWAAIVCLVGAGQEINSGEPGMQQWGEAIKKNPGWEIVTPANAINGLEGTAGTALFPYGMPKNVDLIKNDALRLKVPIRSYRSEKVSEWVDAVLENRPDDALEISKDLDNYPITLVRSINECRSILKESAKGTRRCGLLASAGASRLVAEGLGVTLSVQDKDKIAHWYLKPHGDFRSSNSLEVTANEYTSQGLELDFAGICWGGDFARDISENDWCFRRLHKTTWQNVHNTDIKRYILNKYRVFLTRAREGLVLFVPYGDSGDSSRVPGTYDAIAEYLVKCGVYE